MVNMIAGVLVHRSHFKTIQKYEIIDNAFVGIECSVWVLHGDEDYKKLARKPTKNPLAAWGTNTTCLADGETSKFS